MANDDLERRVSTDPELKVDATEKPTDDETKGKTNHISGYAAVFDSLSQPLGDFRETIDPHAFDDADLSNVHLVVEHNMSEMLAATQSGTLSLTVDDKGLRVEADLIDTTTANDAVKNIEAGNLANMSFGFLIAPGGETYTQDETGQVIHTIYHIQTVYDVSLCAFAAYTETDVQVNKRSYQAWLADQQTNKNKSKNIQLRNGDNKEMEKTIIPATESSTDAFTKFIKSKGKTRDGLTEASDGVGVVVPSEVIKDVINLKQSTNDLAQFVTYKQLNTSVGTYPIMLTTDETLKDHTELSEIGDLNANLYKGVKFEMASRAAKLVISNDLIQDAALDIVSDVKQSLKKLVLNTNNQHIAALFTGADSQFAKVKATGLDDIKHTFNVELDPALDLSVVVSQTTFNYLDTLKDSENRYILQPSLTAPSGKQLFGKPVIVLSDKLLPASSTGALPMIVGDLAQSVLLVQRSQVEAQWQAFDIDATGVSIILRNDYEVIDSNAARYVEITPAAAAASDPKAA